MEADAMTEIDWLMTESDWLTCNDPAPMLDLLDAEASPRKLRLFGCACCRRIWNLILDEKEREIVEAAERHADGLITAEEMRALAALHASSRDNPSRAASESASQGASSSARRARAYAVDAVRSTSGPAARAGEWRQQCDLMRCIFGNSFATVAINPSWLSWNDATVPKIAQSIYDARRFADLPILADALEDAGCDDRPILDHCRSGGEHVRGCWVVDLLLGKK
jgi:hypothetical protein